MCRMLTGLPLATDDSQQVMRVDMVERVAYSAHRCGRVFTCRRHVVTNESCKEQMGQMRTRPIVVVGEEATEDPERQP